MSAMENLFLDTYPFLHICCLYKWMQNVETGISSCWCQWCLVRPEYKNDNSRIFPAVFFLSCIFMVSSVIIIFRAWCDLHTVLTSLIHNRGWNKSMKLPKPSNLPKLCSNSDTVNIDDFLSAFNGCFVIFIKWWFTCHTCTEGETDSLLNDTYINIYKPVKLLWLYCNVAAASETEFCQGL